MDGDIGDIEAFRPVDAPAFSSRLPVRLAYQLSEAIDTDAGPLWITPSIVARVATGTVARTRAFSCTGCGRKPANRSPWK